MELVASKCQLTVDSWCIDRPTTNGAAASSNGPASAGGNKLNDSSKKDSDEVAEKFGRINFKLDYSFDKATLTVTVIQAEELPAMDIGGTSDPYVKLFVLPDKKKKFCTRKLKKTLNPVYNEQFAFNKLPFNEMSNKTLMFAIYDHDAVGSDDQIGQVSVPLAAIDLASDDLEFWRDIREPPKNVLGDVCISLRYAPQKRPPQLNVIVIECKNLKQMDLGGASDPYVKINHMVNGKRVKKYKTTVKMADLNPYYNQSFKIELSFCGTQHRCVSGEPARDGQDRAARVRDGLRQDRLERLHRHCELFVEGPGHGRQPLAHGAK